MRRATPILLGAFVLICFAVLSAPPAEAASSRRGNPYSSFNISGLNYGAMKWQQQNRSGSSSTVRRSLWFRR
jgi:hypothetical protein